MPGWFISVIEIHFHTKFRLVIAIYIFYSAFFITEIMYVNQFFSFKYSSYRII